MLVVGPLRERCTALVGNFGAVLKPGLYRKPCVSIKKNTV